MNLIRLIFFEKYYFIVMKDVKENKIKNNYILMMFVINSIDCNYCYC